MNSISDTAILIFSRSPEKEAVHKSFHASGDKNINQKVSRALIEHTKLLANSTGYPVISAENHQHGENFGERLGSAFEFCFSLGFSKVLAIGNDSPELTTQNLNEAASLLEKKDAVLGPSKDGGLYLIGLDFHTFCIAREYKFSWQSEHVQSEWKSFMSSQSFQVDWLEIIDDINNAQSLAKFLRSTKIIRLKKCIISIFKSIQRRVSFLFLSLCSGVYRLFENPMRGPPDISLKG